MCFITTVGLEWIKHFEDTGLQLHVQMTMTRTNGRVSSSRLLLSEHQLTFLIWWVDVIAIAHHGPDGFSQTVPVGLFGSLIQQSVRHQARITSVLQILERKKRNFKKTKTKWRQNVA